MGDSTSPSGTILDDTPSSVGCPFRFPEERDEPVSVDSGVRVDRVPGEGTSARENEICCCQARAAVPTDGRVKDGSVTRSLAGPAAWRVAWPDESDRSGRRSRAEKARKG